MKTAGEPHGQAERWRQALAALERLLRDAQERKLTGGGAVQLSFNQGGITRIKVQTEESIA